MTRDGRSGPRILGSIVVGLATALAVVGIAIALFFNPVWVGFEQDRTNAAAWTGYTPDQVHVVTNDILREVYLGPGTFAQTVNGAPVFAERERSHMADVRRVVVVFFGAALLAALFLLVSGLFSRGGAWLHPQHNMFLSTAHTEADIDRALQATDSAMAAVTKNFGRD